MKTIISFKKLYHWFIFTILITSFLISCSTPVKFESKKDKNQVILASAEDESCLPAGTHYQFGFFYNAFPINTLESDDLFINDGVSYRVIEDPSWYDLILSVPLIYLTTTTMRVFKVEVCDTELKTVSESDIRKRIDKEIAKKEEQDKKAIEEEMAKILEDLEKTPSLKPNIRLTLKNGKILNGVNQGADEKFIKLQVVKGKKVTIPIKKSHIKNMKYLR